MQISVVELIGYVAVIVNIGVYLMRTMIPLRVLALVTNVLFIAYSFFAGIYPTLLLNGLLLPLNGYRLAEMIMLVRKTRLAARNADFDMSFIRPFTVGQKVKAGQRLFARGDKADAMYLIDAGEFLLPESGIKLTAGDMVGELGLLAPGGLRTQSLVCETDGDVLRLDYDRFRQLYFQNPKFGYFFLQLVAGRLFENIGALEKALDEHGIPNPLGSSAAAAPAAT